MRLGFLLPRGAVLVAGRAQTGGATETTGPGVRGAPSAEKDAGSKAMLLAFLDRIGLGDEEAEALLARAPSAADLKLILHQFLKSVPFENLGQHTHPAGDGVAAVAARKHVPSLDVHRTLKKIVCDRRGGFCFELNFAFAWLLRSLGYAVRVGLSYVCTPDGPVPGHLALLVDGLGPHALHVDPGFGDAPREPMPAVLGSTVTDDMIGDQYTFVANDDPTKLNCPPELAKRFGQVSGDAIASQSDDSHDAIAAASRSELRNVTARVFFGRQVMMRSRAKGFGGSVMPDFIGLADTPPPTPERSPPEPVYLLNFVDDCALDCDEFRAGLAHVLADDEKNPFSQKRMCFLLREKGFDFIGKDYVKEVRDGKEMRREPIESEAAYRATLRQIAGIEL